MKRNTIKKYGYSVIALLVGVGIALLLTWMLKGKITETLSETEAVEQSKEKDYQVNSGDTTYTFFADGTLVISGVGKTKSFATLEESKTYFLREIYKSHTGEYPVDLTQTAVFHCVLDRVKEIVVKEGVTGLGLGACSYLHHAELVSLPESLETVENFAFLGTGQYAESKLQFQGAEVAGTAPEAFLVSAEELLKVKKEEELPLRNAEEWGTVPDRTMLEVSVTMGDAIEYALYSNGVLVVRGLDSTYDFEHDYAMESYLMEEFHCMGYRELQEKWFDRVVEIVIAEGVTRIGDHALAQYKNVRLVSADSLEELGKRAFLNCGTNVKETVWELAEEKMTCKEDSFLNCNLAGEEK